MIGVAVLLVVGIAGSVYMGARARNTAIKTTVDQATEIADNSLGLVFRPEDLTAPVPSSRATDLTTKINSVVTDPSSFDSVTLWSQDGQILYSTNGRIGNTLDGERDTIREALRGKAQTSTDGAEFSVMIPLQLHSGVGEPTAVEMTTAATPITSASGPWNTNGVFLAHGPRHRRVPPLPHDPPRRERAPGCRHSADGIPARAGRPPGGHPADHRPLPRTPRRERGTAPSRGSGTRRRGAARGAPGSVSQDPGRPPRGGASRAGAGGRLSTRSTCPRGVGGHRAACPGLRAEGPRSSNRSSGPSKRSIGSWPSSLPIPNSSHGRTTSSRR